MRSRTRTLTLVASALAISGAAVACGGGDARGRLYGAGGDDPVQRALQRPARMSVVFWPALGQCMPTEIALLDAFDDIERHYPDIRFVTVLPAAAGERVLRYGRALPGEVVRLDEDSYERQNRLGPRPRVEVWSARGELLLLRSVPPLVPRVRALAEEIVWSRSFTVPLSAPPVREPT